MFSNQEFKDLYDDFLKMYQEEGDVYQSMMESISSDYKHNKIPNHMHKTIIVQILNFASIEYFKKDIRVLTEKDIIEDYGFE